MLESEGTFLRRFSYLDYRFQPMNFCSIKAM